MLALALAATLVAADPPQAGLPNDVAAADDVIAIGYDGRTAALTGGTTVPIAGEYPAVAAASDGTAIVASKSRGRLVARIRRPGQRFAKTLRLGGNSHHHFRVAAAPGGWSAAAWVTPGQKVSSPVRLADPPVVGLDAAGNPFALWHEFEQSTFIGRIHGAKLADAPSTDMTAPTLIARLPERVTVAKSGAFSFSILVACDEACDVRIDVGPTQPGQPGYDLRELSLPAGGHATVRISPAGRTSDGSSKPNARRRCTSSSRPPTAQATSRAPREPRGSSAAERLRYRQAGDCAARPRCRRARDEEAPSRDRRGRRRAGGAGRRRARSP